MNFLVRTGNIPPFFSDNKCMGFRGRFGFIGVLLVLACGDVFCQEGQQRRVYTPAQEKLRITAQMIRLVPEGEGGFTAGKGYHLYIKKIPGVNSVLLTETTKDPEGLADNYAYRAEEYNPVNGDEIRYLDGKQLVSDGAKFSLIDSTPEPDPEFGQAFHIYIPHRIVYGYSWTRNGAVEIGKGTFINIRAFSEPYADYGGEFMDNPFMFDLEPRKIRPRRKNPSKTPPEPTAASSVPESSAAVPQKHKPLPALEEPDVSKVEIAPVPEKSPENPVSAPKETAVLTDRYNSAAAEKFGEISGGSIVYSKGPETIVADIAGITSRVERGKNLDVVFAVDATGSMKNDIETLKKSLIPALTESFRGLKRVRVGLLFYRDYGDSFNYYGLPVRVFGFTENTDSFSKNLNSIRIYGSEGGDIPEAVYEALYASIRYYSWDSSDRTERRIILIGDAEPHPKPRGSGKYSKEFVLSAAAEKNVKITPIILPDDR